MKRIVLTYYSMLWIFAIFTIMSCSKDSDLFYQSIDKEISENIGENDNDKNPSDPPPVEEPSDSVPNIDDEVSSTLKAFPSAFGGGAYASGGRGGRVYHVTNLNDSGSGSLRWALSQPRPATIVFDVSGVINIRSWLVISGKDLTIAGQTAPEGGITITSTNYSRLRMESINNLIIRYIRVRPMETPDDAFEIYSNTGVGSNIMLDHMSLSYGGDETFDLRGRETHNVTFQRGLIAEGKTGALFGDTDSEHFSYDNSFLNSLFYNVPHRVPNAASDGRVDIINNVAHNWNSRLSMVTGDIQLNHINNYYSMGGKSTINSYGRILLNQLNSYNNNRIYTSGNIIDKGFFEDPLADNRQLWAEFERGEQSKYAPASEFVNTQYPLIGEPLPIKSAVDAYLDVIHDVGANAFLRADGTVGRYTDANDTEYLSVMTKGEGMHEKYQVTDNSKSWFGDQRYQRFVNTIDSTPINQRPEDYDTDRDGMPDLWEIAKFGDLSRDGTGDHDGDGYTDLEEFLNLVDFQ